MNNQELAKQLGGVCVSGEVLTGEALVKYLDAMPSSMLDDLLLLHALLIIEKNIPNGIERVTAKPNSK